MDYTKYLKKLIGESMKVQIALEKWQKETGLTEEDIKLLEVVSRLVGYCQATEGILEEDKKK